MPQPGRAQPGRIALPQPRPRRDLDAPRPRRQGREHDDGRGAPSTGSRSGLLREPHRAGLRYAGRRPDVARASLARRRPGCLRGRLRMTMRFTDRVALITELTLPECQRLITFILDGTFLFCHTVGPVMKRQRGGKIVNISSIAGRGLSASSSSAYAAAKGGIIAFTRKLAHELGPFGVTVNAIAPSLTLTERIRPRWAQRTLDEQTQEIARTPLRRVAEAPDQARVICYLASRDADFVTGVTIDVTGGV